MDCLVRRLKTLGFSDNLYSFIINIIKNKKREMRNEFDINTPICELYSKVLKNTSIDISDNLFLVKLLEVISEDVNNLIVIYEKDKKIFPINLCLYKEEFRYNFALKKTTNINFYDCKFNVVNSYEDFLHYCRFFRCYILRGFLIPIYLMNASLTRFLLKIVSCTRFSLKTVNYNY